MFSNKELFDEMFPSNEELIASQLLLDVYEKSHKHLSPIPIYNDCNDIKFLFLILVNGDVYPCCFLNTIRTQKTEYFEGALLNVDTEQYKLGNVFTDNIKDILNSTTPNSFNNRDKIDLEDSTNYCKVCLARWNRGC